MNRILRFCSMIIAVAAVYATAPNTVFANAFVVSKGMTNCSSFGCYGSNCNNNGGYYNFGCATNETVDGVVGIIDAQTNDASEAHNCNVEMAYSSTYSCKTCPSGKTRIALYSLVNLTQGTHFSLDDSNDSMQDIIWTCGYSTCEIDSDIYACVNCETTLGSWTMYNSTNKSYRQQCKSCGGLNGSNYYYGCAANTYYVSGSGTGTVCVACPSNATCTSTVGHTDGFTCKAGYYKTGTTCTRCNTIEGIQSSSTAGSTSCTSCCIPANSTGSDTKGSFKITSQCCNTSC